MAGRDARDRGNRARSEENREMWSSAVESGEGRRGGAKCLSIYIAVHVAKGEKSEKRATQLTLHASGPREELIRSCLVIANTT